MNKSTMYKRYRFPAEIIQYAVWLYFRFNLSHRDIEDLLAQRGVIVTHESIRLWCNKFGSKYAARLRRKHQGYGDTFLLMKCSSILMGNNIIYGELWIRMEKYANNRAELSHQPTRVRERGMRKFKSVKQAQRFLNTHAAVYNLFNLGRHLVSAETYRYFRLRSFASWKNAVMV